MMPKGPNGKKRPADAVGLACVFIEGLWDAELSGAKLDRFAGLALPPLLRPPNLLHLGLAGSVPAANQARKQAP